MIITEAQVVGRNKTWVWLRIPWKRAHKIIQLPPDWLPHGSTTAKRVKVEYDPRSVRPYTEEEIFGGYTAEVKLLDVLERHGRPAEDQSSDEVGGAS